MYTIYSIRIPMFFIQNKELFAVLLLTYIWIVKPSKDFIRQEQYLACILKDKIERDLNSLVALGVIQPVESFI